MSDEQFHVLARYPYEIPDEAKAMYREDARRKLAGKLLEFINQPDKPIFTVQLESEENPTTPYGREYHVWLNICRVRERYIEIPKPISLADMPIYDLSHVAAQEIWRRVKTFTKRLFRRKDTPWF